MINPSRTRSRLQPGIRRSQLVELGVRLISERPYDDFSLDEVAEQAGVTRTLLYHYFPTKRDFYLAALRSAADHLLEITNPPADLGADEALGAGLDAYLRYVEERPEAFRAVLRGGLAVDTEVIAVADRVRRVIYERVVAGLGLAEPVGDMVRYAIIGWIGEVEAVSLDWASRRQPSREKLTVVLTHALQSTLESWGGINPG